MSAASVWTRAAGRPRLPLGDVLGLRPLPQRLAEVHLALRGDPDVPGTRFGLSSLRVFRPRISVPTWLGFRRRDRRVPIYNLFNHTPTALESGWSVRVTQVRDHRGGVLTYDSHNGTDFAVPVGTQVVAPASGTVIRVSSEFHRGGLKVFLDHGDGVATSCNHLARSLVRVGDRVRRGEPIALSGYSGLDGVIGFPWVAPHVHFNVFLNGRHVDPFPPPASSDSSLWLDGAPRPPRAGDPEAVPAPSALSEAGVAAAVAACRSETVRAHLEALPDIAARGAELLFQCTYFPTRFDERPLLYTARHPRRPTLTLPFAPQDVSGIWLPDEP